VAMRVEKKGQSHPHLDWTFKVVERPWRNIPSPWSQFFVCFCLPQ
jgi:hypothetical protein